MPPEVVAPWAQWGFAAAAFAALAWWTSRRIEKSEDRSNTKIDELEHYVRHELTELVERQGKIVDRCSDVLDRVENHLAKESQ